MIEFIGKDHRLTIEERELYIPEIEQFRVGSHVYLQTCNRVELYRGDGLTEESLVRHLFRVVSGLESAMIGESHIQGQVKRAYGEAIEQNHISAGLHRLFQGALRCGKRVRTETGISEGAVSHSHAAVIALKKHFKPARNAEVLIVGVNELTERIVRFLGHGENHYNITLCNRTAEKARLLADQTGAGQIAFGSLKNEVSHYDAIVSATSSPEILIEESWFEDLPVPVLIDLAVPRDIDPRLGDRTALYNVTDLESIVAASLKRRSEEQVLAEQIVNEEVKMFIDTYQQGEQ